MNPASGSGLTLETSDFSPEVATTKKRKIMKIMKRCASKSDVLVFDSP